MEWSGGDRSGKSALIMWSGRDVVAEPNDLLPRACECAESPYASGAWLSCQELAELVNAWVWGPSGQERFVRDVDDAAAVVFIGGRQPTLDEGVEFGEHGCGQVVAVDSPAGGVALFVDGDQP